MKTETSPQPIHLKDYRAPDFYIPTVHLHFALGEETTQIRSQLRLERNQKQTASAKAPLVLNGEQLRLLSVRVDGRLLAASDFTISPMFLTLPDMPDSFDLEIVTEVEPQKNLACEGLYRSSGMFCTQCEAESFRRITYFLDRPDVMAVYTVTIEADRARYPILLSNGNRTSHRDLPGGRHEATWHDPFKKPCYLFALVAGDLGVLENKFKTRSGREVQLQIFSRKGLEDRCQHAMNALKWSMKWDEDTYGLEYDLDIFMIVVAEDFNMGAMENKGLNIFNANYVLAKSETATDHDFNSIASVVGHEYFHNWTGNRITCRDWFQLSLKEGLTVFRDQRFSADLTSEAVQRIEDVIRLRTLQFAEDAGPTAHPIRPQSYMSIDNFYTLTIYEKGAEVIRMIETILGRPGFRKGMDLYFKRHDGQAVTTEDFVAAMSDANGVDFTQFKNWYDQAGTPSLKIEAKHDAAAGTLTLKVTQSCPPTPGQSTKKQFHIPLAVGLIGRDGRDLPLLLSTGEASDAGARDEHTLVLHVREPSQEFVFTGIREKPVLSALRGLSAPVRLEYDNSDEELSFLIAHDSDPFCRWEAAQLLTVRLTKELVGQIQRGETLPAPKKLLTAFAPLLKEKDAAFVSFMLNLPAEPYLAQFFAVADVDALFTAREHLKLALAMEFAAWFRTTYDRLVQEGTEGFGPLETGRRSLKNRALEYLALSEREEDLQLAVKQRREARNMTEEIGALEALNGSPSVLRSVAMKEFYEKWKAEPLVMNKWFTMQALSSLPTTLGRIKALSSDPAFDKNNPNKIYSLYAAYARFNQYQFNAADGAGYEFIAGQVMEIDARNPQVAARLMAGFGSWRILDEPRKALVRAQLSRILAHPGLSTNVFELATKMLG